MGKEKCAAKIRNCPIIHGPFCTSQSVISLTMIQRDFRHVGVEGRCAWPSHGYASAQRLEQISKDFFQVHQGSIYEELRGHLNHQIADDVAADMELQECAEGCAGGSAGAIRYE